jgi:hypothetical protein
MALALAGLLISEWIGKRLSTMLGR